MNEPTNWRCEMCGDHGQTDVPEGASFHEGLDLLRQAHAEAVPSCAADWGLSYVRIDVGSASRGETPQ